MNAIKVKNNSFNKDIRRWILKSNAAQALGKTISWNDIYKYINDIRGAIDAQINIKFSSSCLKEMKYKSKLAFLTSVFQIAC